MVYGCPRTATVKSINYTTLAKLQEYQFVDLYGEYPLLLKLLRDYISGYEDNYRKFMV